MLGAMLRGILADIPSVTIHDKGERLGGIVTFTVDGLTPDEVRIALRQRFINTSVVPVDAAMRSFPRRRLTDVSRASVHYYNTEDELARVAETIREFVS
jgi:selenocysteine lyase/cysteine desulfurase